MSTHSRTYAAGVLLGALMALLLCTNKAPAQSATGRQRLAALQQQNAWLQQQMAVQVALQQTTALLQSASRPGALPPQRGAGVPNLTKVVQQEVALQLAVQETTALLQASLGRNSALSQTALQQLNTLQSALQETISLQGALPTQDGQLTPFQLQMLSQEQIRLIGLLTTPPPLRPRRYGR